MHKPLPNPLRLRTLAGVLGAIGLTTACGGETDDQAAADSSESPSFLPEAAPVSQECGDGGQLKAELFGAISAQVHWRAEAMSCDGMPRPEGAGARLRFAGELDDGRALAVIIALPELEVGDTAKELSSNVTLIEEGSGRFFSTDGLGHCWTDISTQTPLENQRFAIDGTLYCINPLPEINGAASVSIRELEFSGRLDWGAS